MKTKTAVSRTKPQFDEGAISVLPRRPGHEPAAPSLEYLGPPAGLFSKLQFAGLRDGEHQEVTALGRELYGQLQRLVGEADSPMLLRPKLKDGLEAIAAEIRYFAKVIDREVRSRPSASELTRLGENAAQRLEALAVEIEEGLGAPSERGGQS